MNHRACAVFFLLTISVLLAACSGGSTDLPPKNYYLAPEPVVSGASVGGVDVASGKLSHSETDLRSSTLSFSRVYSSGGVGGGLLGGWQHNFASTLDGGGIPYEHWKGIKSHRFRDAEAACIYGWEAIREEAYNGQLADAYPIFREGLCDLYLDSDIVASLPVRHIDGDNPYPLHTLTRPDGTTYTFFQKDGEWITTTRTPLRLIKSGDNWQLATLDDGVETYNANGQLISITNAAGQTTTLAYTDGNLSQVTGHFGRTLELTYDDGKLISIKGPDGTVQYAYDSAGRLTAVTKVDGSKTSYRYSGDRLTGIVDASGNTVATYAYDPQGRVMQTAGPNGSSARTLSYSSDSVVVTDSSTGATDTYRFLVKHGVMKIASITDSDGNEETREYDSNGYPGKVTAKNGTVTLTTYNRRGLLVSRTESAGTAGARTTLTEWHPDFRKPTKRVEPGKVTFSEYNPKGLLTRRIQGTVSPTAMRMASAGGDEPGTLSAASLDTDSIREERFEYTENGQPKGVTAANGARTEFAYDAGGNRISRKNALGHEEKMLEFDAAGRVLKSQDANGLITENSYDSAGRLTSTTTAGQTTRFEYDSVGRQTKIIYPDGSTLQKEYDAAGNLTRTIDQDGNVTENSYDSNGNQLTSKVMDASGTVLLSNQSEYNSKNQLVKNIDAEGNVTRYEYDTSGNNTKIIDARGNETTYQYDGENRLVKTIDPLGGETVYEYDINGNRTKVIAPNGATTTFEYDNFNQLIRETSPDRGVTSYAYDLSGNRVRTTDANGNVKITTWDLLNRKTSESWANQPDLTITYEYDSCHIGSLCSITDKSGGTTFSYDGEGRVTQKVQNIEGINLTIRYSYTEDGKLQSITYPSGRVISYSYQADKISGIELDGSPFITDISYNAANQLTGWRWDDGIPYTRTYDTNGRLKSFPLGDRTRTLNYDPLGNITGWTDSGLDEYNHFGYDALNRLTAFNKNRSIPEADDEVLQQQRFSYDANGNRLNLKEGASEPFAETVYQILEASNRLTKAGTTVYRYDANGNIIDDGNHSYSYDARNRLSGVDGVIHYLYNSDNMRVKKVTPQGVTLYGWDNDRIFGEYDGNGNAVQETVYLGSIPVAILKADRTYRIYADQIDTPRAITDSNNSVLWRWEGKPFGESLAEEDVDGDGATLVYNLRFPGQYYDAETGKHYNFNRDYDPATGRYVQSDPIGLQGGMNSYFYANSSPLVFVDKEGLYSFSRLRNAYQSREEMNIPNKGGTLAYNFSIWSGDNSNSCAVRLSNAFNRAGYRSVIDRAFKNTPYRTLGDKDGFRYMFRAREMAAYLGINSPANKISDLRELDNKRSGLVYFENFHIDLLYIESGWFSSSYRMIGNYTSTVEGYMSRRAMYFVELDP